MTKKNLRSVAASLTSVAASLPSQYVAAETLTPVAPITPSEPIVQFSFGLRKSQRKELQRLASDADMTMRAFILDALKGKGLTVTDEDLLDLRKRG